VLKGKPGGTIVLRTEIEVSASRLSCILFYEAEFVKLMERDQVSEEQARRAIAAQMPLEDKARLADHLIDNSGEWEETCAQLRHVAKRMELPFR